MFQLLLIRHGQSANNALPESQRVPDPGLTPLGTKQARKLAENLKASPPNLLFCSAFRRALETTAPIAAELSLRPIVRWDIFEQGGCYEGWLPEKQRSSPGLGRSAIIKHFGEWDIDERIGEAGWYAGHPMESDEVAVARAKRVQGWIENELIRQVERSPVPLRAAFVIHADFKSLLLDAFSATGCDSFVDYRASRRNGHEPWNTSVSELTWTGEGWRLDAYNRVAHLTRDEWSS